MKRSRCVKRVLLGGLTAGALTACTIAIAQMPRITSENYYTNETFISGAGYYHAPFQAFFPRPYNQYDATRKMYYYGGQWGPTPHRSIVNISAPTDAAARAAQMARTDMPRSSNSGSILRSGFGSSSGSHFSGS